MCNPTACRDHFRVRCVDGVGVVHDVRSGQALRLPYFAVRVWVLCDGSCDPSEVARFMRGHPDEEPPLDEVRGALLQLQEAGLLLECTCGPRAASSRGTPDDATRLDPAKPGSPARGPRMKPGGRRAPGSPGSPATATPPTA